jgi:hypothetical protein
LDNITNNWVLYRFKCDTTGKGYSAGGDRDMMPYSEIHIGDVFSDPAGRGYGKLSGLEWFVVDKKEGLIKIQAYTHSSGTPYGKPLWKMRSNRMFCETWRVLRGMNP